jgi:predicted nicotinamide N-methyase
MASFADRNRESFFTETTTATRLSLCPEIRLSVAPDLQALWNRQEEWFGRPGLPPPYWAVPWPGGQALARYVLDHPALVRGRTVLDVGAGSGLCAIAAAMCGGQVTAADTDPAACVAIAANAKLNQVAVVAANIDPVDEDSRWEIVLAADLWYERFMAGRMTGWLRRLAVEGTDVFLGDLGRAYFPRRGVVEQGCFRVESGPSERGGFSEARAWQFKRLGLPEHGVSSAVIA